LFYGGRNDQEEFFHRERVIEVFEKALSLKIQATLYIACSRDIKDESGQAREWIEVKKGYVQEYLKETKVLESIKESMAAGGHLMICGNKNTLGKAVIEGLTEGPTKVFDKTEFEEMKEGGKIMVELWNE
jgi:sulfite reductase alpha subunit-like flavoprotein